MATVKRPLTEGEAEEIRGYLPPHLQALIDVMFTVKPNCWNCEYFSIRESNYGYCAHWLDMVPMDKRQQTPECFEMREGDPF